MSRLVLLNTVEPSTITLPPEPESPAKPDQKDKKKISHEFTENIDNTQVLKILNSNTDTNTDMKELVNDLVDALVEKNPSKPIVNPIIQSLAQNIHKNKSRHNNTASKPIITNTELVEGKFKRVGNKIVLK